MRRRLTSPTQPSAWGSLVCSTEPGTRCGPTRLPDSAREGKQKAQPQKKDGHRFRQRPGHMGVGALESGQASAVLNHGEEKAEHSEEDHDHSVVPRTHEVVRPCLEMSFLNHVLEKFV